MSMKTYDPKNVSIIIGSHIVSGFADGTFINVERRNPTWSLVAGASGETERSKSNDKSGRITLTLLQSSASNDILSGFAQSDELDNSGTFPLLMKEDTGTTIIEATEAWCTKPSNTPYGKESQGREWVIETGELVMVVGGIS